MRVLHINAAARAGGAEQVANDLLDSPYVESNLLVKADLWHQSSPERAVSFPTYASDRAFHCFEQDHVKFWIKQRLQSATIARRKLGFYRSWIAGRADLAELFNQVDVLVFPLRAESFALLPAEAMACGVCVVAADAAGLPEVVNSDVGLVFRSENARQLRESVEFALSDVRQTRERGQKAAEHARVHLDLDQMQRRYSELYRQICRPHPRFAACFEAPDKKSEKFSA